MDYIDLHVHSNASDGTFTPSQLTEYAIQKKLRAFALTDHDTVSGIEEALFSAKANLEVIPGIELSAHYNNVEIHILGLYIDYKNPDFISYITEFQKSREDRNYELVDKLSQTGVDISMDKIRDIEGNAVLTRAHFAKYLMENGYVRSKEEAFQKYLGRNCPCYVQKKRVDAKDALSIILKANGIPVLAHPLLYKLTLKEINLMVKSLKDMGLAGIEAIYSTNSANDELDMKRIAHQYNLLITGGSDFHGENKPHIDLGVGKGNLRIPYYILEEIVGVNQSKITDTICSLE